MKQFFRKLFFVSIAAVVVLSIGAAIRTSIVNDAKDRMASGR